MWTCESCGLSGIADSEPSCPGCGHPRFSELVLTGAAGSITLRTDLVFGNKNLPELVGDDARYAERDQFRVFRKKGEWWIAAVFANPKNPIVVDDEILTTAPIRLLDGNAIAITSKSNPTVRKGAITVRLG